MKPDVPIFWFSTLKIHKIHLPRSIEVIIALAASFTWARVKINFRAHHVVPVYKGRWIPMNKGKGKQNSLCTSAWAGSFYSLTELTHLSENIYIERALLSSLLALGLSIINGYSAIHMALILMTFYLLASLLQLLRISLDCENMNRPLNSFEKNLNIHKFYPLFLSIGRNYNSNLNH